MSRKTIKVIVIILLLLTMILLSACEKNTTIKIGVVGTMSGKESDLSVSGRRGIELAVSEINASGGINGQLIELVVKDDLNSTEQALKVDQEFVQEGIQFVIGHFTSGMTLSVIDYVNSENLLMLGPTISADQLSQMDDHFIRFIASTREQAEVLSNIVKQYQHKKTMVIFDTRNKGFTDKFVENFQILVKEKTGFKPEAMEYDPSNKETRDEVIKKILSASPEGLFIVASAEECAVLAQNIKNELPKIQLYGPLWANTQELLRKGGNAVEDMILVGGIDYEDQNTSFVNFSDNFKLRYGDDPTFASMYGYETMRALAQSIEASKSLNIDKVKAKLIEIGSFEGVQESFSIDKYGDSTRNYHAYQVKSGKLRKVD